MFLESSPGFQLSKTSSRRLNQLLAVLFLTIATSLSVGCAGIASSTQSSSKSPAVQINLTPASPTVVAGGQLQFVATLTSTSNTAVVWHTSAGTITGSGLFSAPTASSAMKITVTATSAADSALAATSDVTVTPLVKLAMQLHPLPGGIAATPYSANLTVTGGVAPYDWQIAGGSLPQGFSLDRASGVISGITSQTGNFNFTASVTDANSAKVSGSLGLKIGSALTGGNFDGPAELPRVYVQSDLAHTPAAGKTVSVPTGGDLQQALDRAKCGDTIELQSGGVYTGQFKLPAQSCDDNHWIIVRTSARNSSLPAEGTRISPCYAGISSLPGRPAFNCVSTTNVMAKVQFGGTGSGPIIYRNGANHYRFIGLEITRPPGGAVVYNLAVREKGGSANHIIFDRCWIHGTTHDETQRGVMMSGTQHMAVVDSYLSDFHCISQKGACIDSQAVAGGLGTVAMGPFKIVNNFLEAAAENIMLGGDAATTTPADIEVRHNHLFKPLIWKLGQHGFVGGPGGDPFIIKNLFELKNAKRVLFEGNILENSWGGFSQYGFGIVIGPKNQAIGTENVCPICQVTDITIRYVKISHVGGGMQLGNGVSSNGGVALAGERYSVHDVTFDDIDGVKYEGHGSFAQVSTGPGAPVLQDVTINHVTAFQPVVMLNIGDDLTQNQPMKNFVYTNNLVNAGQSPIRTTGGGPANCAYASTPRIVLPRCFQPYVFIRNAIIDSPSNYPASQYPTGNFFPASTAAIHFVNFANGNGGDYHLQSSSPYKNAGTDGKDLGADIDAINSAIAGAE
jgi:hypothetical protein